MEEQCHGAVKNRNVWRLKTLNYFLGIKVEQDEETGSIWIGQPAYTENLLRSFGMHNSKPVSTPVDISSKLKQATDDEDGIDQQQFQSAIGSLMYLSVNTRPDIS